MPCPASYELPGTATREGKHSTVYVDNVALSRKRAETVSYQFIHRREAVEAFFCQFEVRHFIISMHHAPSSCVYECHKGTLARCLSQHLHRCRQDLQSIHQTQTDENQLFDRFTQWHPQCPGASILFSFLKEMWTFLLQSRSSHWVTKRHEANRCRLGAEGTECWPYVSSLQHCPARDFALAFMSYSPTETHHHCSSSNHNPLAGDPPDSATFGLESDKGQPNTSLPASEFLHYGPPVIPPHPPSLGDGTADYLLRAGHGVRLGSDFVVEKAGISEDNKDPALPPDVQEPYKVCYLSQNLFPVEQCSLRGYLALHRGFRVDQSCLTSAVEHQRLCLVQRILVHKFQPPLCALLHWPPGGFKKYFFLFSAIHQQDGTYSFCQSIGQCHKNTATEQRLRLQLMGLHLRLSCWLKPPEKAWHFTSMQHCKQDPSTSEPAMCARLSKALGSDP